MVAMVSTKVTASPMPIAVSTFLDTPKKGQIPRNCDNTTLFTKMATMIIPINSITVYFLVGFIALKLVKNSDQVSQHDKSARRQDKEERAELFGEESQREDSSGSQQFAQSTQQGEGKGESQPHPRAVKNRRDHAAFRGKRFRAP